MAKASTLDEKRRRRLLNDLEAAMERWKTQGWCFGCERIVWDVVDHSPDCQLAYMLRTLSATLATKDAEDEYTHGCSDLAFLRWDELVYDGGGGWYAQIGDTNVSLLYCPGCGVKLEDVR